MARRQVVLWDIDHTLVDTRGVGRELSAQAFRAVTGREMLRQATVDGITEAVIFRETAKLHGLGTDRADFERFAAALADAHATAAEELRSRGLALAGAEAVLDRLAADPGIVQTVVTGNVRRVAEIKLATFGLDRHITWEVGAYGEDADERADLVRAALRRVAAYLGLPVEPRDAVVVGDTSADVRAGRAVGVPVIAVATGRTSAAELRAAGAAYVVPDLTDDEQLADMISSLSVNDPT
ncbi:haloacid dehalogenase-like hydrolase [Streptomyces sp. NPDC021020]|uniref:haloacid dehalogenase-like hydrolase n=1 Tax=Streptomyces sp. NPDC021020 TaxID=3365109 RepID=UPI00379C2230